MTYTPLQDRVIEQPQHVTFVVFEGGEAPGSIEKELQEVRFAITLDTVESILESVRGPVNLVVYSDKQELLNEVLSLSPGVVALQHGNDGFHFGKTLRAIINDFSLERVVALGGASAPFYFPEIWRFYERLLVNRSEIIVENNPGSADVIGFHPAAAMNEVTPPAIDNHLGRVLRQVGLRRILIPNTSELHFDIDVPTDVAVLREIGAEKVGPRTRQAMEQKPFIYPAVEHFARRLLSDAERPSLCLAGRVESSTLTFYRANFPMRMHCVMEGRGLRYLVDQKEPVSTPTTRIVESSGFDALFDVLTAGVEFLAFDWRPTMAGLQRELSAEDRFLADLGQSEKISDPVLREFSRAAGRQDKELILGGHCLVSGGLWQLGRETLAKEGRHEWRPFPGHIG